MDSQGSLDASSLLAQIQSFQKVPPPDDETRKNLIEAARGLQFHLEEPLDTTKRLRYSALEIAIAHIFNNLDLFSVLESKAGQLMTTEELAQTTNTDPVLLRRLLRYAASVHMVTQAADDSWASSRITKSLSLPSSKADVDHAFGNITPMFQDFPQFLAQTNYRNPTDSLHTVHQITHNTDLDLFGWFKEHPEAGDRLNIYMASHRNVSNWLDAFPFDTEVSSREADASFGEYLFVDVGGGFGHMAKLLRSKYPKMSGRVAVQDLPQTVANAPAIPGVETQGYDFFQPQPIKGARAYYLRNVLHDWPDNKAILILKRVIDAMDQDSILLLDEKVLPDQGLSTVVAGLDLSMLMFLAGMERSETQWRELVGFVGLSIKKVWQYTEIYDSVLVVTRG